MKAETYLTRIRRLQPLYDKKQLTFEEVKEELLAILWEAKKDSDLTYTEFAFIKTIKEFTALKN